MHNKRQAPVSVIAPTSKLDHALTATPPAFRASPFSKRTWKMKRSSVKESWVSPFRLHAGTLQATNPATRSAIDREEKEVAPGVFEGFWQWTPPQGSESFTIRYQRCGDSGPSALMVHGFGGNCDHWRKNLPAVGSRNRAYAIDLLGYGYSDKPDPRSYPPNSLYTFEVWGAQLLDFIEQKISQPTFLLTNSVGGLAALEAAIAKPHLVPAVFLTNISLRKLHADNQSRLQRPFVAWLQRTLRETSIGEVFFANVAKGRTVKSILQQCYGDKSAVTDELVDKILTPGLRPGAARVFLQFLSYSDGPLPERQLAAVKVPVSVVWGAADPWEKVEWGRDFVPENYASITDFTELPGVGHCPMDEAPTAINKLIQSFIERHTESQ